jgi:hypothetical protein
MVGIAKDGSRRFPTKNTEFTELFVYWASVFFPRKASFVERKGVFAGIA